MLKGDFERVLYHDDSAFGETRDRHYLKRRSSDATLTLVSAIERLSTSACFFIIFFHLPAVPCTHGVWLLFIIF